jgi:hypothetical protein
MRISFLQILIFLLLLTTGLAAQHATPSPYVRHLVHRAMHEKLRGYDLLAAIRWAETHPGQPVPTSVFRPTHKIMDRDAEVVVSGNAEAESEVHAAINPIDSNNIITAAIIQDPTNFLAPLDVPVRYTTNFGQTWQTSNIQFNPGTSQFAIVAGGGDPVLAFDKNGKAYLSWLVLTIDFLADPPVTLALYASTSTNKGQSWSSPTLIDQGSIGLEVLTGGAGSGDLVDKQWMAADQSNSAYEGNLYVSYTRFEIIDSVNGTAQILLKRKLKAANTFSPNAVQIHANTYGFVQFSSIDVDGSGEVHVSFFAGNSPNNLALYHTVSTDGGLTFAPETKISNVHFPGLIDSTQVNPIAGIDAGRTYPCPHLRAGKEPGILYAVWSSDGLSTQATEGYDVWLAKSTDNGDTWATPKRIHPGTDPLAEQFYPALAVSPTGVVCVSYYDRSADPTGTDTHYAVTYSFDEGENFTSATNATTVAADFADIGSLNGGFGIGEYTQIVCAPHTAIPVWADGRSNDGDIDIYAAFMPISDGPSSANEAGTVTELFSVQIPNPATQNLHVSVDLQQPSRIGIEVFAADGRSVYRSNDSSVRPAGLAQQRIALAPGRYLCRVETAFGWKVLKVVVQ